MMIQNYQIEKSNKIIFKQMTFYFIFTSEKI